MPRSLREAIAAVRADGRHQQLQCPGHDDQRASLSVDLAADGKVLLKCHAHCAFDAVLAAAGLTRQDVAATNGRSPTKDIVEVYDYRDEAGLVLYQVVRYVPKGFKQRKPDGAGGYIWSLNGVRRVLYRLPELRGPRLWGTEGEKDANRLVSVGLNATTFSSGGGAKWLPTFTEQLRAAGVQEFVLVPHNDDTGVKFTAHIRAGLEGSGIALRVVTLPGLAVKGDVSDWLNSGHTVAELEALAAAPPATSPDANRRFRDAITPHHAVAVWGLADNAKGLPLSTHANVGLVIDHMPELLRGAAYDEFLDRTIVEGREWREGDDTGLCMWLQEHLGLSAVTPGMVHVVLDHRLRATPQHCVRAWLEGLVWDQEPRIALAFEECWGALHTPEQPFEYVRAVSANFFLGMVARVMRPGCQLDTMPIFEGPQGLGKSSALRLLGGAWYALGAESVTSKDFFQVIPGKWLIEIGEMDSFSRAERERTKIAISTPVDRYRASYGRYALDHPRQCVFAGTTNRDDYGHDDTGLRRFWPVRCTDILLEDIAAHRDQWFAEAVAQFRAGASWWEVPTSAGAVQRARQAEDVWTATVLAWCIGKDRVTSAEVLAGALAVRPGDMDRPRQARVSHILQLAGWTRQTIRRPGEKPVKGFRAPDDPDL